MFLNNIYLSKLHIWCEFCQSRFCVLDAEAGYRRTGTFLKPLYGFKGTSKIRSEIQRKFKFIFLKTTINLMYTIFDYMWEYETKGLFENKCKKKVVIFGYWLQRELQHYNKIISNQSSETYI